MNDGPHLCEDVSPVCLSLHICSTLSEKDRKKEIPNFLCGHRKGHSPFLTPKGSVYTLFFVVTSAHTLLGPFILMLRLVDQRVYLDKLYSCTVIMLSSLCTTVRHFVVTSAHNLLGPVCCKTCHYLHTLVVHTLCLDQLYCCTFI
jgi:hypothetical protein